MPIEIRVPAMGEGITDVTITRWLVQQGDKISKDTPLVEIATDKVDSEIASTHDGTISQLLFPEGTTIKIGETIVILAIGNEEPLQLTVAEPKQRSSIENLSITLNKTERINIKPVNATIVKAKFISPFVRQLAIAEGITIDELETITGTGENERITKNDILHYAENRPVEKRQVSSNNNGQNSPVIIPNENETIVELDRMRKLIAKNMLQSRNTAPHVTSFVEANISKIVEWRNKVKATFQSKYNEKITYLPIMIDAVVKALKDFPTINASLQNDTLILKKDINIGIATALPDGNLIVPVVKKADTLGIPGLAKSINELALKARKSQLLPTDIQGGTFTVTNIGTFGNIGGTPIINQPELAVLAIGTIVKKPIAVKIGEEYGVAIQDMVELWLSYDHRIVDGFLGGSFLKRIADYLEQFDPATTP